MESVKYEGPRGADDIDEEFDFNLLADAMKKMGGLVKNVATDFNKAVNSVTSVFDKLDLSLTDEERLQIGNIFEKLSDKEKDELLEILKKHDSEEDIKTWWEQRCDSKNLIEILTLCSDAFREILNTGSNIGILLENFGDALGTNGGENTKNFMDKFIGIMEKEFGSAFNFKCYGGQKSTSSDIKKSDKCLDYNGNDIKSENPILTKYSVSDIMSNLKREDGEISKNRDHATKGHNLTVKSDKKVCNSDLNNEDDSTTGTEYFNIRNGLIDEAVNMVKKQNKINQDCDTLISLFNTEEMKLFLEGIGGDIPIHSKMTKLEHQLDQINQKLDIIINKFDIRLDNQSDNNIEGKLDDIALDLELIRNKL